MAAERPVTAKKAVPRKAPAMPAPAMGAGIGEWPEDPMTSLLGQLLTVQTDTLRVLEKLLEVATKQADLVQAGTTETVAARRDIATVAVEITRIVALIGPALPDILAKVKAIPTRPADLLAGVVASLRPAVPKGGRRR